MPCGQTVDLICGQTVDLYFRPLGLSVSNIRMRPDGGSGLRKSSSSEKVISVSLFGLATVWTSC